MPSILLQEDEPNDMNRIFYKGVNYGNYNQYGYDLKVPTVNIQIHVPFDVSI